MFRYLDDLRSVVSGHFGSVAPSKVGLDITRRGEFVRRTDKLPTSVFEDALHMSEGFEVDDRVRVAAGMWTKDMAGLVEASLER